MINTNPYEILEVSPEASNAEINKAFAMAMKTQKYPPDVIAKARKALLNKQERIIADYLHPIIPNNIIDFQRQDFSYLEEEKCLNFLDEFDGLEVASANVEKISESDCRIGLNLINFL
ncbi:MAG: hypothetical protein V7K32_06525 [Nostoc sp.]|uniref:hypothetical protein n=1 Tax=Nostoc sp. TaxID=1180 RepID=UPI002FF735E1